MENKDWLRSFVLSICKVNKEKHLNYSNEVFSPTFEENKQKIRRQ